MLTDASTSPLEVTVRGEVPDRVRAYASRKVEHAVARSQASVLRTHVVLTPEQDPALTRPARIEVGLDVDGVPVRADIAGRDLREAADLVVARLRRLLMQLQDRTRTQHRWLGLASDREWRRGDLPRRPVPYYPRPVESRRIVRRKTFPLVPITPNEAAYKMDLLDHDFYLFTNLETGADTVIFRWPQGGYGLPGHPPQCLTENQARERLDVGGERFVFYLSPIDGRGRVLYRRYDGHYGLITGS